MYFLHQNGDIPTSYVSLPSVYQRVYSKATHISLEKSQQIYLDLLTMTSDHPRRSPRHRARTIAWTLVVEIEGLLKDMNKKKQGEDDFLPTKLG